MPPEPEQAGDTSDPLDLEDLRHLARVAEGRGASLPESAVVRLMQAGLVRRPDRICEGAPALELTPDGLARVRSSDQ
jgi:hypothetical protein